MLKAKKIRLDVSQQDAATLEFMQGKCLGLYNWWVLRLRAGERWHWQGAKHLKALHRSVYNDWGLYSLVMDRDENSALNILRRYLARPGPHT